MNDQQKTTPPPTGRSAALITSKHQKPLKETPTQPDQTTPSQATGPNKHGTNIRHTVEFSKNKHTTTRSGVIPNRATSSLYTVQGATSSRLARALPHPSRVMTTRGQLAGDLRTLLPGLRAALRQDESYVLPCLDVKSAGQKLAKERCRSDSARRSCCPAPEPAPGNRQAVPDRAWVVRAIWRHQEGAGWPAVAVGAARRGPTLSGWLGL